MAIALMMGISIISVVAEFFGVMGISSYAPQTLGELIPYLLTVFVGVALVSGVFRVIGRLVELLMDFRRW